jgi:AbiV family abortive infection protein
MENAQELIEEAELLLKHNKHARAFALAHLATEELVKFNLLIPVAAELARNHNINWKEIGTRLTNHHVKIRGAMLIDFMRRPPEGGVFQASELSQQMTASTKINDMKNHSLYTSQIGHDFFKPSELIDDQTAIACVSHARELLHLYQMFYLAVSMVTGMTEEGFRGFIEMPLLQKFFEELGSMSDLSNLSAVTMQRTIADITTFLNDPILQPFLAELSSVVVQEQQANDRTN